ncbi:Winged helix-turn-helix DNA-binding [Streptomyces sp. Ncost-T10-10d]|nr:Winged helix-turn-helix DNA-binding [Streptomyces sp. Ncost-T10-10d]
MNRSNSGANLPTLRSHNAALVLDLLRVAGQRGISRLELAERTGLTPQAVSKITARLRAEGLATDAGHRASTGGKPRTVLRLVPDAGYAVGMHLDRDELTVVLVDLAGAVAAGRTAPLDFGAPADEVVAAAACAVAAVRDGGAQPVDLPVLGVGVAVPGPLDHRGGVLHRVTGFPQWDGYPLRDALAARTGLPVVVDKDTNAAALGLALRAAGAGDFAYLHLGTGLGAGAGPGAGGCTAGPVPGPVSSGTRPCSWTGRCAAAGGAAASRRSVSPPSPAVMSRRPHEYWVPAPPTSSGCSTSTG